MDLLEEVKKIVNTNLHLEDSVLRLQQEREKLAREKNDLEESVGVLQDKAGEQLRENQALRQHVRNLVDRLNMVKAKLTGAFVDKQGRELLAAEAHQQNNSVWIPDAIERTIYEGAIDQVSSAVEEVLRLLPG